MAFTSDTLSIIAKPIGGVGIRLVSYYTDDDQLDVTDQGYVPNAALYGLQLHDLIFIAPKTADFTPYLARVDEIEDDGSATLAVDGGEDEIAAETAVFLGWGQSNIDRNSPQTLIRDEDDPPFLNTPGHPYYSTEDNGDGTYDVTFEGDTSPRITVWRPGTETIGPVTSGVEPFPDGLNNALLGMVHRFVNRTGKRALIILIAEGSRPVERFLPTSTVNITGITQADPCVISVDDIRQFCANSEPDYDNNLLRFPIRIEGVAGMTELNGNTYTFRARDPDHTVTRAATSPVPGTIELYDLPFVNLVSMVDSTGFGAYTSGGVIHMHHLWDEIEETVPAALAAAGLPAVDFIVDIQGEANSGAVTTDVWSTVGGISTPAGFLAKRLELKRLFREQTWCRNSTGFLSFELAREDTNAKEKPRNDVIDLFPDLDPMHAVASSGGYETVDLTHFADLFGYGWNSGYSALNALLSGQNKGVNYPKALRDLTRPDGSIGSRSNSIGLIESAFDMNDYINAGREWLNGQMFTCQAGNIIVPAEMNSTSDRGGYIYVNVYSTTGTTPGRADGKTTVSVPGQTITGVANNGSSQPRYTSVDHGYTTGETVIVKNVVGVPGANGQGVCTVIDDDTFDITSLTFSGAYSSGGTAWNYEVTFTNILTGATYANEYIFQDNTEFATVAYTRSNNWSVLGDLIGNGYYAWSQDEAATFRPYASSGRVVEGGVSYITGETIEQTAALTADRALTLPDNTTGEYIPKRGLTVRILRTSVGAFNLNVGTGPLKALATNTWCDVTYNGTAWRLSGYGAL